MAESCHDWMESAKLLKTLLLSQELQMRQTFADLRTHRSPPSTRPIPIFQAHIQACDEIDHVLKAGRLARLHALAKYQKDLYDYNKYQKELHDNALHVLSTKFSDMRNMSPELI